MPTIRRFQPTFAERYPIPFFFALLDMLLVIAAGLVAHHYRFGDFDMSARYNNATFLASIIIVLCQAIGGVYGSQRGFSLWRQYSVLVLCWGIAAACLMSLAFVLKVSEHYSRIWFTLTLAIGALLCFVLRGSVFLVLRKIRSVGMNLKSVLLVGTGGVAASKLNNEEELKEEGFSIKGSLDYQDTSDWYESLINRVDELGVHEVWLFLPLAEGGAIRSILYALRHHTVAVRFIPEWGDIRLINHKVSHIAGLYSLDLSCSPMDGPARLLKRLEDMLLGTAICILILPVCLLIAGAVRCSSPGPVLFKQYRIGFNGERFKVYKFRSMVVHAEGGTITQASRNDARVTKVGAFLRRTSLDELPQFFNVLQGRMSIVGPRPHALAHNEYYKDLVESYMQRHKVKPGITGWAQVSGYRGETDTLDKMQSRVEHDLWYIDNWSLLLDLKIIFLTVFKGFVNKNAF
ncbi:undecaprenyl-phosphate glucose phosphotransferase [Pseudomonas putida]|uniref:Undecaprenyl-phosphate glucose phosphotransferase n=1 Tax=Pseudomonas putida TaxID=303 RepID=A0A1X1A2W4_PSEPU|nr:undecaprenyl-phosphate glucose phosphotransferase [Pseudomonas putida]ORL66218.1 undecaprenyl-phosphate glucose phosphotransferase [Pseudomonas putida]